MLKPALAAGLLNITHMWTLQNYLFQSTTGVHEAFVTEVHNTSIIYNSVEFGQYRGRGGCTFRSDFCFYMMSPFLPLKKSIHEEDFSMSCFAETHLSD